MSIRISEITKIYGRQKALDAVTVEIVKGEVIGLLGPNGAGKSTLMKILTCFIPPTSGDAEVCGFDVMEQSIEVRKVIGYLPENNPLYGDLYIREFLAFIAGMRGIRKNRDKRVDEMINLVGLGSEQHKKIGALSKGYRQRVGLAQALIHDPAVLILDEPTSGLDPNQLLEIRGLIRDIGREKTVMMSTHIMQEVEAICNRVVIIHKGRIVADDTTKNLRGFAAAQALIMVEFDRETDGTLLQSIPGVAEVFEGDARSLELTHEQATRQIKPRTRTAPSATGKPIQVKSCKWSLLSDAGADIRGEVFQFAVDNNLKVLSLQREEQKLEEVFQELTRN